MDRLGNGLDVTIQQVLLGLPLGTTYAIWNPSDKSADVTLSNGDLTAAISNSVADAAVRGTIGKSSGKWYWEITLAALSSGIPSIGIANSSLPLTSFVGETSGSWGYVNGQKYNNSSGAAYGATYTVGDVISVALDMDGGTITFYKNGASQGQAFSGITGTIYPAVSNTTSSTSATFTANFGATAFTYTPPTGHVGLST